ncbi:MAG TPA: CIA30 family protein [Gemmatimonadaceae bacterium]|nr:CIA30 family protein [Gemmatimonadaceae bacterium]
MVEPAAVTWLDDFAADPSSAAAWVVFTDRVMGGVSTAAATMEPVAGRRALHLRGTVSLERNGGFVQVARPLGRDGAPLDARGFSGLVFHVCGTPGPYFVHLRTAQTRAPWQHYRAPLPVEPQWTTVTVPWSAFTPQGLATPLDVSVLTRLGVVGGQAAFEAAVAVERVGFITNTVRIQSRSCCSS